ncbi:maleylpyruvate isomerase family mycothiol-dependent enzyme [Mycolicibacterium arenosum]|uniref:Maleylpyruvate isomerase family mycothiol-dependent enzyme n=1 Tax=Mycolicibacterium arenosum TaxID=2952157 RepID=A0ABT1M749_9MYCO|nr:maleylpyruvate isomerase family mycothiol-dependent enzyme [Mycolicibacterium sp. CAU 1645]MCP9275003.1 maleylpyruvate isomerase family mycothiol-dependent enzyme [Mycolicibacterium sp. CAU 1645]
MSAPLVAGLPDMTLKKSRVWSVVHAERAALVEDLRDVPDDAWSTPSLCRGWSVHDVVAHLVDTAKTSRLGFARRMIAAGFDFDGDNERGIARERGATPGATLAALRAAVPLTLTPPAPRPTRLVEAFVHGEDIRRPLGIDADYPVDAVAAALAYQARASTAMGGGRDLVAGLRLVATDCAFEFGAGAEVRGRAIDLLLAASGRIGWLARTRDR